MADASEEVCEMVTFAGALVLNIGNINKGQIESMLLAGGWQTIDGCRLCLILSSRCDPVQDRKCTEAAR